jgi:hypothetical protein
MDALAEALGESGFDALTARLTAAQVIVVQRELANMNHDCLVNGESARLDPRRLTSGAVRPRNGAGYRSGYNWA